jgi:hypothetical protein
MIEDVVELTVGGFVTLTEIAAIFLWMPYYGQIDTVTMFHSICA